MRLVSRLVVATVAIGFIMMGLSDFLRAQNDAEKIYKTHCVLCHAPDGSGESQVDQAFAKRVVYQSVV
jgi:cytochrome c